MTAHFNGPILGRDKGGNRGWYGNLPVHMDPDYYCFFDDFNEVNPGFKLKSQTDTFDSTDTGTFATGIVLPAGSQILQMYVDVDTVWNSTTSDVLEIGDGSDPDIYGDVADLQTSGRTIASVDSTQATAIDDIGTSDVTINLTITSDDGSGDLDQGSARITVLYAEQVDIDDEVWTTVKDVDATVAVTADTQNGVVKLSSAGTTDDNGATLQTINEFVKLAANKEIWFETRVKVSDADQMDAFVGLVPNIATNPEAALTDGDRIGFQIDDGNASILAKTEKNTTETSNDTGIDVEDDTYVKLGFRVVGTTRVDFYVDREKVATHTTNLPDDEELAVTLFELSGDASGTKSMTADYVLVAVER